MKDGTMGKNCYYTHADLDNATLELVYLLERHGLFWWASKRPDENGQDWITFAIRAESDGFTFLSHTSKNLYISAMAAITKLPYPTIWDYHGRPELEQWDHPRAVVNSVMDELSTLFVSGKIP